MPGIKELIRLRCATVNDCSWLNSYAAGQRAGMTEEKLNQVHNPESDVFTERERAVLHLRALWRKRDRECRYAVCEMPLFRRRAADRSDSS